MKDNVRFLNISALVEAKRQLADEAQRQRERKLDAGVELLALLCLLGMAVTVILLVYAWGGGWYE